MKTIIIDTMFLFLRAQEIQIINYCGYQCRYGGMVLQLQTIIIFYFMLSKWNNMVYIKRDKISLNIMCLYIKFFFLYFFFCVFICFVLSKQRGKFLRYY